MGFAMMPGQGIERMFAQEALQILGREEVLMLRLEPGIQTRGDPAVGASYGISKAARKALRAPCPPLTPCSRSIGQACGKEAGDRNLEKILLRGIAPLQASMAFDCKDKRHRELTFSISF